MGNRLYFTYSGSAPTATDCTNLAASVESAWSGHLASLIGANIALNEVDVLDIATTAGLSGQWSGSAAGTASGPYVPIQCATNIEFGIARRYRGGKPRMYLPPTATSNQYNDMTWSTGYVSACNSGAAAFFGAIEALSVGSMGTLQHVNLSYYHGYNNVEVPDTRAYAKPTYRATAITDKVTGYYTKGLISSQRRRRTSTTP